MPSHLLILAAGLAVLAKSADFLVEYAARVARRFGVSDLVVGLILTSVGTSLPELASSVSAALAGRPGLVIGNVVGSNIANIGLVLGAAAVVRPFATAPKMHDRDGFILLASVLLFFGVALDNRIGRGDAGLLLAVYLAYVVFAARTDAEGIEHRFRDFLRFVFDFEYARPLARLRTPREPAAREERPPLDRRRFALELAAVGGSLAALLVSAHTVVAEAVWLAGVLELPENLIGLSLIAVGTSLPELVVAVAATRKGKAELVVGNVIGSNIANALLVVGLAGAIRPLEVTELSVVYTLPILLFFSLALLHFVRTDWRVDRAQGLLALAAYAAFLTAAFVQGWS